MRKIGSIVTLRTFQWTSGTEIPVDIMLKGEWGPCRYNSVADPGFAVGWGTDPLGGRQHPMRVLFGRNMSKLKNWVP